MLTPRATSTPSPGRQQIRRFLTTTDQKISAAIPQLLVLVSRNNDGSGNYQAPGDPNCQIIAPASPGTPIGAQVLVSPSQVLPQKQTSIPVATVSAAPVEPAVVTDTRVSEPPPVTIGGRSAPPCGPPVVSIVVHPDGVYLSWGALACAVSFNVYRRNGPCSGVGSYTLIASGVTSDFYLDDSAPNALLDTFSYVVTAVDASAVEGPAGACVDVTLTPYFIDFNWDLYDHSTGAFVRNNANGPSGAPHDATYGYSLTASTVTISGTPYTINKIGTTPTYDTLDITTPTPHYQSLIGGSGVGAGAGSAQALARGAAPNDDVLLCLEAATPPGESAGNRWQVVARKLSDFSYKAHDNGDDPYTFLGLHTNPPHSSQFSASSSLFDYSIEYVFIDPVDGTWWVYFDLAYDANAYTGHVRLWHYGVTKSAGVVTSVNFLGFLDIADSGAHNSNERHFLTIWYA